MLRAAEVLLCVKLQIIWVVKKEIGKKFTGHQKATEYLKFEKKIKEQNKQYKSQ